MNKIVSLVIFFTNRLAILLACQLIDCTECYLGTTTYLDACP